MRILNNTIKIVSKNAALTAVPIFMLASTSSASTVLLDFTNLLDTSGGSIGDTNGQIFQVGTGVDIQISWTGSFNGVDGGAPTAFANGSIGNGITTSAGVTLSNTITVTALNGPADFRIVSQAANTNSANGSRENFETGSVVADGDFTLNDNLGINPFDILGNTIIYDAQSATSSRGQFDVGFTGTTFTYNYSVTGFPNSNDQFFIAVDLAPVPEPSSTALLGLGGLALLARRKR